MGRTHKNKKHASSKKHRSMKKVIASSSVIPTERIRIDAKASATGKQVDIQKQAGGENVFSRLYSSTSTGLEGWLKSKEVRAEHVYMDNIHPYTANASIAVDGDLKFNTGKRVENVTVLQLDDMPPEVPASMMAGSGMGQKASSSGTLAGAVTNTSGASLSSIALQTTQTPFTVKTNAASGQLVFAADSKMTFENKDGSIDAMIVDTSATSTAGVQVNRVVNLTGSGTEMKLDQKSIEIKQGANTVAKFTADSSTSDQTKDGLFVNDVHAFSGGIVRFHDSIEFTGSAGFSGTASTTEIQVLTTKTVTGVTEEDQFVVNKYLKIRNQNDSLIDTGAVGYVAEYTYNETVALTTKTDGGLDMYDTNPIFVSEQPKYWNIVSNETPLTGGNEAVTALSLQVTQKPDGETVPAPMELFRFTGDSTLEIKGTTPTVYAASEPLSLLSNGTEFVVDGVQAGTTELKAGSNSVRTKVDASKINTTTNLSEIRFAAGNLTTEANQTSLQLLHSADPVLRFLQKEKAQAAFELGPGQGAAIRFQADNGDGTSITGNLMELSAAPSLNGTIWDTTTTLKSYKPATVGSGYTAGTSKLVLDAEEVNVLANKVRLPDKLVIGNISSQDWIIEYRSDISDNFGTTGLSGICIRPNEAASGSADTGIAILAGGTIISNPSFSGSVVAAAPSSSSSSSSSDEKSSAASRPVESKASGALSSLFKRNKSEVPAAAAPRAFFSASIKPVVDLPAGAKGPTSVELDAKSIKKEGALELQDNMWIVNKSKKPLSYFMITYMASMKMPETFAEARAGILKSVEEFKSIETYAQSVAFASVSTTLNGSTMVALKPGDKICLGLQRNLLSGAHNYSGEISVLEMN